MHYNRHDSHTATLGERTNRPYWRLWVEDSGYARLGRNNFVPGSRFNVVRRPGTGLVINEALMGDYRITPRRNGGLLSYEARDLGDFLGTPEVRVRISVGNIVVAPLLRFQSVARTVTEHWTIAGDILTTPQGEKSLRNAAPLNLTQSAAVIEANLDELNLVFATELIGNQRPARVIIRGNSVIMIVAGQFLRAAGYGETSQPGEFAR